MKKGKEYVDSLTDWDDFKGTLGLSPDDWGEIDLKVKIVGEIINARQEVSVTQKALENLCGVKQPMIARIENGDTDPQLGTVLKLLRPLGKTLAVVDIPPGENVARG
ncbi:MAG: helix-turn-helix domain-containing protein [Oscillospiraceae bacterium]|nr:helix-turn-helix domain-containing protein [Oscillospiraceae bacterium]